MDSEYLEVLLAIVALVFGLCGWWMHRMDVKQKDIRDLIEKVRDDFLAARAEDQKRSSEARDKLYGELRKVSSDHSLLSTEVALLKQSVEHSNSVTQQFSDIFGQLTSSQKKGH